MINSSDRRRGSGKRDASGANLKGGVYALRYIFHSIVVISGSDRPNRRGKEMSCERETLKGGTHVT